MAKRLIKSRSDETVQYGTAGMVGDIKMSLANTSSGWISCDGKVIGKTIGDYQGVLYKALYDFIWNLDGLTTVVGDPFSISSAKGVTADADWEAGKTLTVDFSSNEVFIRAKGSGRNLGSYQTDAGQDHKHDFYMEETTYENGSFSATDTMAVTNSGVRNLASTTPSAATDIINNPVENNSQGTPRVADETRSKNVALNYFIKY